MTDKILYNRGSEWRKWDLHVHSPNTHLENKYNGVTTENFLKKIADEKISVIGLTNYFNFAEEDFILKTYLKVYTCYLLRNTKASLMILI